MEEGSIMVIERQLELRSWWFGSEALEDLRALCVAENRADRRSVRLRCPSEESGDKDSD
jgi:hypothetical protein